MIKLLALDLDGTVLDPHGRIPDENRSAIAAAEEAGVLVTIATGRRYRDARPVGLDLGLNAPLVTHNGGLLKYALSEVTVAFSLIGHVTALEILRVGKQFGGDALVSTDPLGQGTLLCDRISEDNIPLQKYLRWSERLHGAEAGTAVRHVERLEDELESSDVLHISYSGSCHSMREMQAVLEGELRDTVNVLATVYPQRDFTLIDILPAGASKGVGVERLASTFDISMDEVMAIGDNFNDLGMLDAAGTSVVMGNADPELLARREFYKTVSNDEGGVAAAIERFILNRGTTFSG
jgi:5-amino-6-(5-phospho-D-ribitylamino)uracil phosphatase